MCLRSVSLVVLIGLSIASFESLTVFALEFNPQMPPCDKTNPICQKFQNMFEEQQKDEPESRSTLTSKKYIDENDSELKTDSRALLRVICDSNNPICQMLGELKERKSNGKPNKKAPANCKTPADVVACHFAGKECYTSGKCGALLEQQSGK